MATEVIYASDPTGWLAATAAGIVAAVFFFLWMNKATPTGPFGPFFQARDGNREHGGEKGGKWVVTFIINVDSRLVELELCRRVGSILMRPNDIELFLPGPNTMFFLAGVPIAFVFGDRAEVINPAAAEAVVKYARLKKIFGYKEIAKNLDAVPVEKREDAVVSKDTFVPFAEYHGAMKEITPAMMYRISTDIENDTVKHGSLMDLLKNPMVIIAIVALIGGIGLIMFMG
ncbi:MAG: hypothetical protein O0X93_01750 [Methanocorpusculum sp.]|nr:hypothetical protein [Methanocorpusculum sp.]MDE2521869.1 hypothetical protein [Methanocorpusculum sp.]MDE2524862.1 hypothetical protein [Methanocorpusculum sp.]